MGTSDHSLVLPAWVLDLRLSPDRRWIVTKGDRDLTLNDTRRGRRRTFAIRVGEFAWSADSRRLGISAADGGLYVLEMPSLRLRRLTADHGYHLDWSPDARSLAYLARSLTNGNEAGDLRVVDLHGRVKTVVDAAGDRGGVISDLAWDAGADRHDVSKAAGALSHRRRDGDSCRGTSIVSRRTATASLSFRAGTCSCGRRPDAKCSRPRTRHP